MNIDDLSKSQLLLLTLLVNFVMSIATGIVTVSLLDEAPTTVTQTVNRIVDQTVQTVAPAIAPPTQDQSQPSQEDQLVAAIKGDEARTVTIFASATATTTLAQGIYLPKSRAVVVIANLALPQNAYVSFPDGTSAPVSISRTDNSLMIYGFGDSTVIPAATATVLLAPTSLQQGQAVIGLTADGSAVTGIVSKIDTDDIVTTLPQTPEGAAAVTIKGELIGISTGADSTYISAAHINALLSSAPST